MTEPDANETPAAAVSAAPETGPRRAARNGPAGRSRARACRHGSGPAAKGGPGALGIALAIIALLAGAALFLSGYSLGSRAAATPGTPASDATVFRPFWDVWDSITHSYAGGTVDRQKLVEGAIQGMFNALGDPYSAYMSPEDLKKAREDLGGQFEGIGATIGTSGPNGEDSSCATLGADCLMIVIQPMGGSPAEKAGLVAGDVIAQIDGQTVNGLGLTDAINRVRGPKGSTVVLTVLRDGGTLQISIVRDTIVQSQIVTDELANGTVRYIRVAAFSDRAADDFTAALRAGLEKGQKRIIIDLRDNPGGYVTAARTIASQFVAEGPLFWEENAAGEQEPTNTTGGGVATGDDVKVVVLVNKGSASASEIVAGALQDTGRAILVGETSFGKGTVQEWVDLDGGLGRLPPHDREVADAEQALDPQGRADA